ncbi:MAG: MDR family MFS transporter [Phoenicibacter congonensis]|uniref:MDR family MFS transporter n=1 Tax=Phoenicibacter congonensis TaxID=1944646 RepID=A0AA43RHJ0_9ACTN|nr:MDR family MFS transporter [Phoenicibacter congonensis]
MALGLTKAKFRQMIILLAGAFIVVLNMTLLTPALNTIMHEMNVSQTTVQWLTSGYSLTEAVVIPMAAFFMGRFSNKRLFVGAMCVFSCGSLIGALSPSFSFLLLARVVQACSTGLMMPMVTSIILVLIPKEHRGSAMGIVTLIIGFAPTIGPTLSGVLIDTIGWRAIFALISALSLAIVALSFFYMTSEVDFERASFDAPSVVLASFGLVSLLLGISSFSSSDNKLFNFAEVAVGLLLIGIYAKRQLSAERPMLQVGVLKESRYRTCVIVVCLIQGGLIGMETIMPLYIQVVLGEPATVSGLTLLPGAVLGAVTGVLAGRIFDKKGVRVPVICGVAMNAMGLVLLLCLSASSPIWFVTIAYACVIMGLEFTMTPVNTWGINSLPNNLVPHAQSTSNTINQVAGSFGTALLVSVASMVSGAVANSSSVEATFLGYHASFLATTVIVGIALLTVIFFVKEPSKKSSTVPAMSPELKHSKS